MTFLTFRFTKTFVALLVFAFISARSIAQQSAVIWNEIVHPPAHLDALIASGTNLIAGTGTGVYLSTDNGQSWAASNNGLPRIIQIRALVRVNNSIFAATDKGVWSSVNEAQSWSEANGGVLQNQSVRTLFINGATVFAGTESNTNAGINSGKVYRTTNQGQSWSEASTGLPQNFNYANDFAAIANSIFVIADGRLYRSTNNGDNWSPTNLPQDVISLDQLETSGSVIFAARKERVPRIFYYLAFWVSFDSGNSWKRILSEGADYYGAEVTSLAIVGSNLFSTSYSKSSPSGFGTGCLLSTDAGKSFTSIGPSVNFGVPFTPIFDKLFLINGKAYLTKIDSYTLTRPISLYQSNNFLTPAATTVSAANYQIGSLASESVASVFGSSLALTTASATGGALPTSLENASVTITDSTGNAQTAPLFYVSPTQINFQLPSGLANGVGTMAINLYNQIVATGVIAIANTAPGLFSANQSGTGLAAANVQRVKPDGTSTYEPAVRFNAASQQFIALLINVNTGTDQAYLNLYGTGIRGRSDLAKVKATIGGIDVPVTYAGAHGFFVGVDQVNILLPSTLAGKGEVEVILTVDNQVANTVKISIQ